MSIALVLDTGALMAYATRGSVHVPAVIAAASANGHQIVAPAACFAEAYAAATDHEERLLLDIVRSLAPIVVTSLEAAVVRAVGDATRRTGRLGLGQAAVEALRERVVLMTADPADARELLDDWQIWDLGSDHPPD